MRRQDSVSSGTARFASIQTARIGCGGPVISTTDFGELAGELKPFASTCFVFLFLYSEVLRNQMSICCSHVTIYFFLAETNRKLLIKKSLRSHTSRNHISLRKFFSWSTVYYMNWKVKFFLELQWQG